MDCASHRDEMLDVLYGEADASARRRVEAHHAECPACRAEFEGLRELRWDLLAWRLPGAAPRVERGPRRLGLLGGFAAAAGLLLAVAGAIRLSGASVEIQRGPVTLRLGGGDQALEARLTTRAARYERDIEALRSSLGEVAAKSGQAAVEGPTLQQVESLIRDSESRRRAELESRLAGLSERYEAQRRYDLARVSAGLSYLDGKAGQHMARTSELVGYMIQASQPR